MTRAPFIVVSALALAACASSQPVSEGQAQIDARAAELQKYEKFPVLGPLPSRKDVMGDGIPESAGSELRSAASELVSLRNAAGERRGELTTDETVAELRSMVAMLREGRQPAPPEVDVEALAFPTPPPLD
ncbi:hypothetical protein HK107_09495 [Parvularcula sp. ZS-1/3]|uniref:DUF3035 domain-containing protein n=1 Tax=Parvularcula mediterranea TaxID=2732508 RepID=A0A7Y3W5J3_9PROT|nr:hypothetical protein [Parvularcula mediterranea]NNU16553.1 hypothetical protein [Parvularcula mediterranea]